MPRRVVVIGGGIAGLSISYELLERRGRVPGGLDLLCLEASPRPGGNIRTERAEGFTAEWGPNGFLDNIPATLDLVRRLGLEGRLLPADLSSSRRFIYRSGKLRELPRGPLSFLFGDVLPLRGRLRVLAEAFGRPPPAGDESVFDFAARRIGREAARVLVGAMVTGIYAGDSRKLSLEATFPKMWSMERQHGSLTRAMLRRRGEARAAGRSSGGPAGPGGRLTSFRDGLEELTGGLARALGPALRLEARAESLSRPAPGSYRVHLAGGESFPAEAVVLAFPSRSASGVIAALDPQAARELAGIPSAPVMVVHLGFDEGAMGGPPGGFGFLVPRDEGIRILGTIWTSSVFPGRAPPGKVLLTTMVGGAHDPEALGLSDAEVLGAVRGDLGRTMGLSAEPVFQRIFRHEWGIPQYTLGHPARLAAIEERLKAHPGLWVAGNSYRGISVNRCVELAPCIADGVVAHLGRP